MLIMTLIGLAASYPERLNGADHMARLGVRNLGAGDRHAAVAVGLAFGLMPPLIATLTASVAAKNVRNIVGAERAAETVEAILAAPVRRSSLLAALLGAGLTITAVTWALITGPVLGAGAVLLLAADLRLAVPAGYLTLAILTPLPLAALGSGVVMALALLVPQATDLRLGLSGNWLPRIGALPALLLFLIVAWFPDIDIALAFACSAAVAGTAALVSFGWLAWKFNPTILLEK
ncbi:hypothetical protein [Actinomadura bangladeshensis]|uniref:Uncharacterized protein n=1 Tax=Actinomadura bangladeshensis TaxID=453573 RepID=A0A4R4PCY8_9ACTN|nr:hypothetical protein [Actinomadura bangladeshensis]TDC20039.1 hypothetical protein E1284_01415 [Actinomadura bangladeshensis]